MTSLSSPLTARLRVGPGLPHRLALIPSLLLVGFLAGSSPSSAQERKKKDKQKDSMTPTEVFQGTNLWTVHFRFQPGQWEAMEPTGGEGGFFGGGRGRGGPGPGLFMAPAFMAAGDRDGDGKLSRKEFSDLGIGWFDAWDQDRKNVLSRDQAGSGLNAVLAPPVGGPGAAPPGGPGRAGGGMNLQGAEGKRNGLASAAGVEFPSVRADLELGGRLMTDVSVRYKGNGTWMGGRATGKRSLKADLNDHVKGQKLAGMSKLNFHNNVTDASWMTEPLAYRLYRDAGVPAPRTAYARLHVSVDGSQTNHYKGLFSMVENIDTHFADERFGSRKGALFKPVTPRLFAYLGPDWKAYNQTYDPKTDLTPEQQQRLIEFCRFVSESNDSDFAARVGDFLALDEFAAYMAVTVWLSELDGILGPGQNFYLHLDPRSAKLQFIPWDLDNSFGKFGMRGTQEEREQLNIRRPWQGENRFLERMFSTEAFMKRYLATMDDFSKRLFLPERFEEQVNAFAVAIRSSVADESTEKLKEFDKAVAGEKVGSSGFGGFGPGVTPIKAFVKTRAVAVRDQLAGKSSGKALGEFGFGGPGRRMGRGGPGGFMSRGFVSALDSNQDDSLSRTEFTDGFARWFTSWDSDADGQLDGDQLREGMNRDFASRPPGGGPPPP